MEGSNDSAKRAFITPCRVMNSQGDIPMKKYIAMAALMATVSGPAFAQGMDSMTFRQKASQADAFEIAASRMALERSQNQRVRNFAQKMITDHSQTSQALNGGRPMYSASGEWLGTAATGTLAGAGIGALVGGPVGAAVGAGVGATAGTVAGAAGTAAQPRGDVQTTGSISGPLRIGVPLDPEKTAMLNELAASNGRQFDRLYGRYQQAAHQEALNLYQSYAQNGSDRSLVTFAQSVVPHLEQHLADARRLPGATSGR
jgi:predicted outer membrane protein